MTLLRRIGEYCASLPLATTCGALPRAKVRAMTSDEAATGPLDDPNYRSGVVELLGLLCFGELSAVTELNSDAMRSPDLSTRVKIYTMAAAEWEHFVQLRDRLEELGEDPYAVMDSFSETFARFHRKTEPSDWLEGLIKAYVGDGLAADFYREIAAFLDEDTRKLVVATMSQTGNSEFVIAQVREAIVQDPKIAGRLALWGRRLMGEALSQAQMVVAERDELTSLVVGSADRPGGFDLASIGRMFTRITEAHAERMAKLGLAA